MNKFLLIDGTALVFRGFYAIPHLQSNEETPTNAILGFYHILFNLLMQEKPAYFSVCFDRPEETQRKKEFSDYKAQRKKAPDNLYSQINPIKEILYSGGLNLLEQAGVEADDLIATLAHSNQSPDLNTLIYSSDLDLLQLVNPYIKVLKPGTSKQGNQIITPEFVQTKYGLTPKQIIDYKGLCGDASDNLPGVKGVGDKTATSLLQEYGSLESIYDNIDKIKGSLQSKLIQDKETAFFCKSLATLHTDCAIPTDLPIYSSQNINFSEIQQAFNYFKLSNLIPKLAKLQKTIEKQQQESSQSSLF